MMLHNCLHCVALEIREAILTITKYEDNKWFKVDAGLIKDQFYAFKTTSLQSLYPHFLKKVRVYCCYPFLSVLPEEKFVTGTPSTF